MLSFSCLFVVRFGAATTDQRSGVCCRSGGSARNDQIDNFIDLGTAGILTGDLEQANFINTIIDGNRSLEFLAAASPAASFEFSLDHCLLRFNDLSQTLVNDPLYDFTSINRYRSLFLNNPAEFTEPAFEDFRLLPESGARERARESISALLPLDLWGNTRTLPADLGALEYIPE